jgi:RimJ/RimL family protein N-acetyltransferase
MPSIPALSVPLGDGRVELRLAAERDIPEILIAFQDDPELHRRLGLERPPSGAQLGSRSEQAEAEREAGEHVELTILEPGSDLCRGRVSAQRFEWKHLRAEVGIWLAPQVRGRGLGRRALRLAAGWLFSACGLERVEVQTEPGNETMLRTARAAGFVREGLLRSYVRDRSGRLDMAIFSLLPSDLEPTASGSAP